MKLHPWKGKELKSSIVPSSHMASLFWAAGIRRVEVGQDQPLCGLPPPHPTNCSAPGRRFAPGGAVPSPGSSAAPRCHCRSSSSLCACDCRTDRGGTSHSFPGRKRGMMGAIPLVLSYQSFPTFPGPSLGAALEGWGQSHNKKDLGEYSQDTCRVQPGCNHIPTS